MLHDCLEHTDRVTNMHVFASIQTDFESGSQKPVPFIQQPAEVLVLQERGRFAFGIDIDGKARQVFLRTKSFLLIHSLVRMPATKVANDLVQEPAKIIRFA